MQNQGITCIHVPINVPIIWFMSNACHMQGIGTLHAYNMHMLCACLYMHITKALKFDFLPILQQIEVYNRLVTHCAHA